MIRFSHLASRGGGKQRCSRHFGGSPSRIGPGHVTRITLFVVFMTLCGSSLMLVLRPIGGCRSRCLFSGLRWAWFKGKERSGGAVGPPGLSGGVEGVWAVRPMRPAVPAARGPRRGRGRTVADLAFIQEMTGWPLDRPAPDSLCHLCAGCARCTVSCP